jgi:iron-sulfur cluster insertion protein
MINVTESAKNKILDILYAEKHQDTNLRVYVQGGGCSGFQYGFALDQVLNEDDVQIPIERFNLVIDAISMQYLQGSTLDYQEDLMSTKFVIDNPNSSGTCGCGSSFYV